MTRADLEEAIANLQYLLSRQFNPAKLEEYNRQLIAFRAELRVLQERQVSVAPTRRHFQFRQN